MLDELHISNLGVIEDATLTLSPGLNVVTGETGAGKTMVVTALQLLVGGRGDTDLVRTGADEAVVEARWVPAPAAVAAWVADDEAGPGTALDEAVVSRRIRVSGRSRVRIEGRLATVGALAETVSPTVEIHAQDSHRRLLEPATQRRLLDAWAGADHLAAVAAHADAFDAHAAAVARRDELAASMTARAREVDHLEREVAEIDAAALAPDDEVLDRHIDELVHADDLRSGLQTAAEALGVDGAGEPLGVAVDALRRLPTETATSADLRSRLDEVVALATDLAEELRDAAEAIDADPAALDRAQARWATVRALTRKYGPDVADVLAHREQAAARLDELRALDQDAASVDAAVATAATRMAATADVVGEGRRRAAGSLANAVMSHLADLALAHAHFEVAVAPGPMTQHGATTVTFLLAPNPGHPPVGLATAASGGERSRVALALEVTLADLTDADVLVFDEVDAGVGGATAMKVGEKLAALASGGRQVLCVTHLAQLAAWADRHVVVDKVVADGTTSSVLTTVGPDERVAELARMLGGETTQAARAHAAELLSDAAP
jgi:DNA repair protein RecN (Recombination protein N)